MFLTVVNLFTYRYALVGHILFSTWMYSNPQIFQASGTLGTLLSAAGVFPTPGANNRHSYGGKTIISTADVSFVLQALSESAGWGVE